MSFFLDLPASTPLVDLSKMAALDMGNLPKVEESGERCIRKIQEFIINELSSSEAGVCKFLQLSNELEFVSFYLS